MLEAWRRMAPFILAGLLLFNILGAIISGGRGNWISVAVLALGLALILWQRRRKKDEPREPRQR